jgi:hypothetical protein
MRLIDWVCETRSEDEKLDIFWQVVCLLQEFGKGQGTISPALYHVDENNDVTYVGVPAVAHANEPIHMLERYFEHEDFHVAFRAPESGLAGVCAEKADVFSLGMLMCYLFLESNHEGVRCELPKVKRAIVLNPFRRTKRYSDGTAVPARDSTAISLLMERMTFYDPELRPTVKQVMAELNSKMCKFGIILQNELSGEWHKEIVRSFALSESYIFTPDKEYVVHGVTLAPISREPLKIPFRLLKKQYAVSVAYACEGRWSNAVKKRVVFWENADEHELRARGSSGLSIPKSTAALYYCDEVYGIDGDALFCESDGFTYEIGYYKHMQDNDSGGKQINLLRAGNIGAPEILLARFQSIFRDIRRTAQEMYCVAAYGNLCPGTIKTLNDAFPEGVRIYRLSDDDLLKGEELYLTAKADYQEVTV